MLALERATGVGAGGGGLLSQARLPLFYSSLSKNESAVCLFDTDKPLFSAQAHGLMGKVSLKHVSHWHCGCCLWG